MSYCDKMFSASSKLPLKQEIPHLLQSGLRFYRICLFMTGNKTVLWKADINQIRAPEQFIWKCEPISQNTSKEEERKEQRFSRFLVLLFSFLDRQVKRPSSYVVGEMNSSGNTVDPTWQLSAWAIESFSLELPEPQSWIKRKLVS